MSTLEMKILRLVVAVVIVLPSPAVSEEVNVGVLHVLLMRRSRREERNHSNAERCITVDLIGSRYNSGVLVVVVVSRSNKVDVS